MQNDTLSGPELAALRERCGISQARLATLLGVARQTINRWENGLTAISPIKVLAIRELTRRVLSDKEALP